MISMPSRWSSSCCTTRASKPFELERDVSRPVDRRLDRHRRGRSTGTGRPRARGSPRRRRRPRRERATSTGLTSDVDRRPRRRCIDEHAPQDPDLGRGESDAVGIVHERGHALDELRQLVVEILDLAAPHPQHRIAVLADLRSASLAPRARVGAALGLARRAFDVVLARHGPVYSRPGPPRASSRLNVLESRSWAPNCAECNGER